MQSREPMVEWKRWLNSAFKIQRSKGIKVQLVTGEAEGTVWNKKKKSRISNTINQPFMVTFFCGGFVGASKYGIYLAPSQIRLHFMRKKIDILDKVKKLVEFIIPNELLK